MWPSGVFQTVPYSRESMDEGVVSVCYGWAALLAVTHVAMAKRLDVVCLWRWRLARPLRYLLLHQLGKRQAVVLRCLRLA